MMKNSVLCPIDFSESSAEVLRWAFEIAPGANGRVDVLYSYRLVPTGKASDVLSFKKLTEESARRKFDQLVKEAVNGKEVNATFLTEIGFFSDSIETYVRKKPESVVVLSDCMADAIYDHKNLSLIHFMKDINTPLLIVPTSNKAHTPSVTTTQDEVSPR